jgi:hypothetical protein
MILCTETLEHLINDFNLRLKELQSRESTPVMVGRINECNLAIMHLQGLVLENLNNKEKI